MALIIFAGSAAVAILLLNIVAIYKSSTQKTVYFNLLALATLFYLIGTFFELTSVSIEAAMVGVKLAYLGIPFIPVFWYLCVREFCGEKRLKTIYVIALLIIPAFIFVLAYIADHNQLLFDSIQYRSENRIGHLDIEPGKLYIIKQLYLYFFSLLGIVSIVNYYRRGIHRFKKQAVLFFISTLIPLFTTATWLINIGPFWIDVTPYLLSFSMIFFYVALHRYGIENYAMLIKDNVIKNLQEGVLVFDKNAVYMDSNDSAKMIFLELNQVYSGTSIEEMKYLPFNIDVFDGEDDYHKEFTQEYRGSIRTYNLSVSHVRHRKQLIGYSVIIYNITPFKDIMSALEVKAHIDSLTNIYNRGYFFERAYHEERESRLAKNNLSMIMFDLDHFKVINDTYGHACGDYVLKTVARIGMQNVRRTDAFGRYGGEEFCILLTNTGIEEARIKADIIRTKIQTYVFEYNNIRIQVTASFGVAAIMHEVEGDGIDAILKRADANMYKAKAKGRNSVE